MTKVKDLNGNIDINFDSNTAENNFQKFKAAIEDLGLKKDEVSIEADKIESDDDLTTIGSSSPFDVERLVQQMPAEDWELEILRDSPFYCEGDECDDFLTGPYKVLFEEQNKVASLRNLEHHFDPSLDHNEPVKWRGKNFAFLLERYTHPNQFDDSGSKG